MNEENTKIEEPTVFYVCQALQEAGQDNYEVRVAVSPSFYATPKNIKQVGNVLYIDLFEEQKEVTEFCEDFI